jgi:hypothetical protein
MNSIGTKIGFLILILVGHLGFAASKTASTSHNEMSANLLDGIVWAKHLETEVQRGAKMDKVHLEKEASGTRTAINSMHITAAKILTEAPFEQSEGHFLKMRTFQQAADRATYDFTQASRGTSPNYREMSSAAAEILENLKNAKHWHDLEMAEFDRSAKD